MKYSLFERNVKVSVDLERFKLLSSQLGFHQIYFDEFNKINNQGEDNVLLIHDDLTFKSLVILFLKALFRRNVRILFLCLELYSISFKAIIKDVKFDRDSIYSLKFLIYPFYLFQLRFFKFLLIKSLIKNKTDLLFLPSDSRANYVRNDFDIEIKVLPNLPLSNFAETNHERDVSDDYIIKNFEYLYLPGRINNYKDLFVVLEYAYLNNYKLVVSSNEKIKIDKNEIKRGALIQTGPISHRRVIHLMRNCFCGVILYDSNSLNQKLSASSKLFEFLYFKKNIITSDNIGVLYEIKKFAITNYVLVENIIQLNQICQIEKGLDERFLYENFIKNIT